MLNFLIFLKFIILTKVEFYLRINMKSRIINKLTSEALKSPVSMKHAAALVKGGKIYHIAYNIKGINRPTSFARSKNDHSHSETNVFYKAMTKKGKKQVLRS